MKITLPIKFESAVAKNSALNGALLTLIDKFSDLMRVNNTEFFPEYTDHGVEHIQSVLNSAEEIITDYSWSVLTPQDIYVLTSSILLHDCAMHLTKAGLWNLINNDTYNGVLMGFTREDEWSARWDKFASDVKKFDESDFIKFFGKDKQFELPEVGCTSMDDDQKIVIGDFVRQYHACIAQVIATHGMPTEKGPYELFNEEFKILNELSGLVARSHNHSLRFVVDLLNDRKREFRNTHPTYLMGVLRIADYLQFKSDRTPKILFNTMSFCSPISINEWKKHLAVISTNTSHPDDELLFVEAFPEDAKTLIGIKYLLSGLQKELDEFWAVNGEVYSRYPLLQKLSIVFRRIKSNIDNEYEYVEENYKSYHPEVLAIRADDQKLFPLLIKPLYGDFPKVGVRELLQNSLDACNERFCLENKSQPNDQNVQLQIHVEIDFDKKSLILTDQGVGMDADTIKDYFLKIGSSYRTSESWKSNFLQEGNSTVPRTGRFGIGMLAGFLIGHKIDVETKYFNDSGAKAISFSYELDSNEIELNYSDNKNLGTKITIHSDVKSLANIEKGLFETTYKTTGYGTYGRRNGIVDSSWWYYLDSPKVIFTVIKNGEKKTIDNPNKIFKDDIFENWNCVNDSILEGMFWRINQKMENIFCNGILIQNIKRPLLYINNGFENMEIPGIDICVFDNQAIFPLSLTRDSLVTNEFFEIEKLNKSVKSVITSNIINLVQHYEFTSAFIVKFIKGYCLNSIRTQLLPLVFTTKKIIPFTCDELVKQDQYTFVDFTFSSQKRGVIYEQNLVESLDNMSYLCVLNVEKQAEEIESAINNFILNMTYTRYWRGDIKNESTGLCLNSWLFVKNYDLNKLGEHFINDIPKTFIETIKVNDTWSVLTHPSNKNNIPKQSERFTSIITCKYFMFAIFEDKSKTSTEFATLWNNKVAEGHKIKNVG